MKINDIRSNDQYLVEFGFLDKLKDKFTDASGNQEFAHYKEGLQNDFARWANLTQGVEREAALKDANLIKQWLTTQYGLKDADLAELGGAEEKSQDQQQDQNQQQATPEPTPEPIQNKDQNQQGQQQAAPKDTAQADNIKANIAANQQARKGGGNSMDLNKWYQDYQAEQNPGQKLNLVKELVNRVADYGPQDVESMKAILKKIRDPQNTPFINAALQKMSAGKDMAINPQGNKPAATPPKGKTPGVARPTAPNFAKQPVTNSVMYHVNAIVEALG